MVFDPQIAPVAHEHAGALRSEFVIAAKGKVRLRPEGMTNPKLPTGEIEVAATDLRILNASKTPPFHIEDDVEANENTRLRYRYLDLRRPKLYKNLLLRHNVARLTRGYFNDLGFIEVETPVLTKSTPEGARDYLVPSRVNAGKFFALPQSPQLFKQLLMVSGFERYYQIVKCFRDEDLRADRQPEFTQLDIEMSFIREQDIYELIEGWVARLLTELSGMRVNLPFPRMTYAQAMDQYGTDRPDTRFGLLLKDVTDIVAESDLRVFKQAIERSGIVKALRVPGGARLTRKELDDLIEFVKIFGAQGLAWIKIQPDGWQSPITKFLPEKVQHGLVERLGIETGDVVLFSADQRKVVNDALGNLRVRLGQQLGLIDPAQFNFVWVTDFPLVEWAHEEKRYTSVHHPFTAPAEADLELLESSPEKVRSRAYDLVLNGTEIGGGSIRIPPAGNSDARVWCPGYLAGRGLRENRVFARSAPVTERPRTAGSLRLGPPVMLLSGSSSIRDVIAFPKTQRATCLMTGAPSDADLNQLLELCLKVEPSGKK